VGRFNAAFGEKFLDITQAQREPIIQPDGALNDLGREAVPAIDDLVHHPASRLDPRSGKLLNLTNSARLLFDHTEHFRLLLAASRWLGRSLSLRHGRDRQLARQCLLIGEHCREAPVDLGQLPLQLGDLALHIIPRFGQPFPLPGNRRVQLICHNQLR